MSEAAAEIPDDIPADAPENEQTPADVVAQAVETEKFDFVLDKYRADGRTEQDAALEQAKAYKNLQNLYNEKMGDYAGAPDEYKVEFNEEMTAQMEEMGIEFDHDDVFVQEFLEIAKETGASQDVVNNYMQLYTKVEMANVNAQNELAQEELASIDNAEQRLGNIDKFFKANLSESQYEAAQDLIVSGASLDAVESLIALGRSGAVNPQESEVAPAVTHEELQKMRAATDENGEPMMRIPEYAAKVKKLYSQLFQGDNETIIG